MRHSPFGRLGRLFVVIGLGIGVSGWPPALVTEAAPTVAPVSPVPAVLGALPAATATSSNSAGASTWPTSSAVTDTVGAVINEVTNVTRNIIQFQFSTMIDAVVQMSASLVQRSYQAASEKFGETLQTLIFGDYGIAPAAAEPPLFKDLVADHWQISFKLALLLLPATLALTTVSALRQGLASSLGYAELREALMVWLVSAGAALASYYLLGLAYRVSVAAANGVALAQVGAPVTAQSLSNVLFSSLALAQIGASITANQPLLAMFLGFFVLFLSCSLVLGLGLALAAFTALAYLLSTLAPVVLVLGGLPPLRWLYQLWLKAVTVVFLLPVVDMLLLKAAVSLVAILLRGDGGWGTLLAGLLASAGVLSVLITINFKVAEMTFGAVGEIARKAWDSTLGVTRMLVTAATFAVGGAALGTLPAAGAAGGTVGAGGGGAADGGAANAATESNGGLALAEALNQPGLTRPIQEAAGARAGQLAPGPASSSESLGQPASNPNSASAAARSSAWQVGAQQARRAQLTERIGQMLSRSRNPLLQGMGLGLQGAASQSGVQAAEAQAAQREAREKLLEQRHQEGQARQQTHDQQAAADREQRELRYQEGQLRQQARDQQFADDRVAREQCYQAALQQRQAERLERQQEQARRDQERQAGLARAAGERSEASMVRWAERYAQKPDMGVPAEVLTPSYPIAEVLGGVLLGAQQSRGFAMPLGIIRPVVESSYGRWRDACEAQSGDAGIQIRREFFNVMADPNLALNPDQLGSELAGLATRYHFTLGDDFAQAVDAMRGKYQWLT